MVATNTGSPVTRVWIISTADPDFLISMKFGGRRDDIILQFNQEADGITLIAGYQRNKLNLPRQIFPALTSDKLRELLYEKQEVLGLNTLRSQIGLSDSQWASIRTEIIGRSDDMRETVTQLEELQNKPKVLTHAGALLFDMFWTAVQIFQSSKAREIKQVLKQARADVLDATQQSEEVSTVATAMINACSEHEDIEPVTGTGNSTLTTMQQFVNTPRTPRMDEESVIYRDQYASDPGLQRDDKVEYQSLATRLIDRERNRELFVFLAHKRGLKSTDVLGADFIYVSKAYQSIAFVQYKVPDNKDRIHIGNTGTTSKNRKQLEEMLTTCRKLSVCSADAKLHSGAFRLGSCPFFYKFTDPVPQITETSNVVAGTYIQACLVDCMLSESGTASIDVSKHLTKSITYSTFIELIKKGQAGSLAQTYSAILGHARAHMKDDILIVALELQIGEQLAV